MATVPLSGTNIRLLSGVPFQSDYKHTRWFETITDQANYFATKSVVHSIINANPTYFNKNDRGHFIRVDKDLDSLYSVNYLMFQNATYNGKWFYGFVTHLEYVNRAVTNLYFEIDVLQTWRFEMNFKPSYVVREHCQLWNTDGTPVINTQEEGLNYGAEYDTVLAQQYKPNDDWKWLVILTKTPVHNGMEKTTTPTVIGTPQPLSVYMLPFMDNDTVPTVVLKDGSGVLVSKPTEVLTNLYKSQDAVNNVVSLYITDYTGIPITTTETGITFPSNNNEILAAQIVGATETEFFNCLYVQKVIDFTAFDRSIGDKYAGYKDVKESKLLMYPYSLLTLDDFKGNRVNFKNEYILSNTLTITTKGSLGTSNKTSYGIKDYNFADTDFQIKMSDEFALINDSPNDVPIMNEMLAAFLQGNRNSLQNQRNQIKFDGITNGLGNGMNMVSQAATGSVSGTLGAAGGYAAGMGSTYFQLKGMQAKQQDIANIPPSISKMGSNTSYTIGNNYNGVFIIKKQIKDEYIKRLEDFFNIFGYAVNEVKAPNLHTRLYWNYIQTSSCNIQGNFNNEDLNELKAVFDNGITLWHTDDVQNYSFENEVI